MPNNNTSALCGGTFLSLILESRKPTKTKREHVKGQTDSFRDSDVFESLIHIAHPDELIPATCATDTTDYRYCKRNLTSYLLFGDKKEALVNAFNSRVKSSQQYPAVLDDMARFVLNFIAYKSSTQDDVLLVKRLIELISNDKSIDDDDFFVIDKNGEKKNKTDLKSVTKVCLPAFLLSVWQFILTKRSDVLVGVKTIAVWYELENKEPNAKPKHKNMIDGSSIKQGITVTCYTPDETGEKKTETPSDSECENNEEEQEDDFNKNIKEIEEKYADKMMVYNAQKERKVRLIKLGGKEMSMGWSGMYYSEFEESDLDAKIWDKVEK